MNDKIDENKKSNKIFIIINIIYLIMISPIILVLIDVLLSGWREAVYELFHYFRIFSTYDIISLIFDMIIELFYIIFPIFVAYLFLIFLVCPCILNIQKSMTKSVATYELIIIILLVIFTILSPYIMSSIEDDDCGWCNVSTYKGD